MKAILPTSFLFLFIFSSLFHSKLEAQATCNTAINIDVSDNGILVPVSNSYRWYCARLTDAGAIAICWYPGIEVQFYDRCNDSREPLLRYGFCGDGGELYGFCPEDDRVYIRVRRPSADLNNPQPRTGSNQLNQVYLTVIPGVCEVDPCRAPKSLLQCDRAKNGTTATNGKNFVGRSAYRDCIGNGDNYSGNDVIYELENSAVGQSVVITLDRFGSNSDLDLFVYDCGSGRCVDYSVNTRKAVESIHIDRWDRDYLIIVDAYSSFIASPFRITASCTDPCSEADALRCNVAKRGNTAFVSEVNNMLLYDNCSTSDAEAPKKFFANDDQYRIRKINPDGRLVVNVFNTSKEIGLFLFEDCDGKKPTGCLGSTVGGNGEITSIIEPDGANWPTGTYYLSLDSECNGYTYNLMYTCEPLDCSKVIELDCNTPLSQNNNSDVGGKNNVSAYKFNDQYQAGYTGRERIFSVNITQPTEITIDLKVGSEDNYDLFLLEAGSCDEYDVIAWTVDEDYEDEGENRQIKTTLEPGEYYIIVDGFEFENGTFEITASWDCGPVYDVCGLGGIFVDNGINFSDTLSDSDYKLDFISSFGCSFPEDFERTDSLVFDIYNYYYSPIDSMNGDFGFFFNDPGPGSENVNKVAAFLLSCACETENRDGGSTFKQCCLAATNPQDQSFSLSLPTGLYTIIVVGVRGTPYSFSTVPGNICTDNDDINTLVCNNGPIRGDVDGQGNNYAYCERINFLGLPTDANCDIPVLDRCYDGYRLYNGEDVVYTFTVEGESQNVSIILEASSPMGLFLYDSQCGERCLGYAETSNTDDRAVLESGGPLSAGVYYLIVDKSTDNGPTSFNIELLCEDSGVPPYLIVDEISCPTSIEPEDEHIIEVRELNNTTLGENLINDPSKKFNIQFNFLNENQREVSIQGKNWDPNTESEIFNFFADLEGDDFKCSYIDNDDFIIRLLELGTRGNANVTYDVKGEFVMVEGTNTAGGFFLGEGRSVIRDFEELGVAKTFAVSPSEYRGLTRVQTLRGITILTNGEWSIDRSTVPQWITFSRMAGSRSYTITMNVEPNTSDTIRTAAITIYGPNNFIDILEVIQEGQCTAPFNADIQMTVNKDCEQQTATLDARGSDLELGVDVRWINPSGQQISSETRVDVTIPGRYTLRLEDRQKGCTAEQSVEVPRFAPLSFDATVENRIDCNNPSAIINRNVKNGTPPYRYNFEVISGMGQLQEIPNSNQWSINGIGTFKISVTDANACIEEETFTVTGDTQAPQAIINASTDLLTCQQTSIQLDGRHPSHNGKRVVYQWQKDGEPFREGPAVNQIEVADPGLYSLIVKNESNGCSSREQQIQINKNDDVPKAGIVGSVSTLTCNTTQANLVGFDPTHRGQNLIYEWQKDDLLFSQGNATSEIQVSEAGVYKLIVRNQITGCKSESIFNLQESKAIPVAVINAEKETLDCNQSSIVLNGFDDSHAAIADILYTWESVDGIIDSGRGKSSIIVDKSGSYILRVKDQSTGCTSGPKSIFIRENKNAPRAKIEYTSLKLTCEEDQLELNAQGQSNANLDFEWRFEGRLLGVSPNLSLFTPGMYRLKVSNRINGCTAEDQVEITTDYAKPIVDILTDFTTLNCNRRSVRLNASISNTNGSLSYEWLNDANASIASGSNIQTQNIDQAGAYSLIVTDKRNGCQSETATINIVEVLPPDIELVNTVDVQCFGQANGSIEVLTRNGQGAISFQWSNGNKTNKIQGLQAGEYQLTVTDEDGCQDFFTQKIATPQKLEVVANTSNESAANNNDGKIELTITGGTPQYEVTWDHGPTGTTLAGLAPAVYTYFVADANGCVLTGKVNILPFQCQNIVLNILKTDASCAGAADGLAYIELENVVEPVNIEWSNDSTTDTIRNLAPGRYEVIITDANNCPITGQVDIEAVDSTPPDVFTRDITVYLNEDGFATINPEDINNESIDKCSGQELRFNLSQSFFNCDNTGNSIPVNLIATDEAGNTQSGQAIVTVLDTIAPKLINCTPFISTNSSCLVNYTTPIVEDNCSRTRLEISDERFISGSVFPVGTSEVVYTLFENNRAIEQCTIMVEVVNNLDFELTTNEDNSVTIDITGGSGAYQIQILDSNRNVVENTESLEQISDSSFIVKGLQTGVYSVQVSNEESCSVDKILEIITTGLSYSQRLEQLMTVFPNPTDGLLYLKFDQSLNEAVVIDLIDLTGKMIQSRQFEPGKEQFQLDLSNLVAGVYHLRVKTEHAFFSKRIILSK